MKFDFCVILIIGELKKNNHALICKPRIVWPEDYAMRISLDICILNNQMNT